MAQALETRGLEVLAAHFPVTHRFVRTAETVDVRRSPSEEFTRVSGEDNSSPQVYSWSSRLWLWHIERGGGRACGGKAPCNGLSE